MNADYLALEQAVPPGVLVALDASATLSYLSGAEDASPAAAWIFDVCISTGRNPGLLSTLTAAELLVRPFRSGPATVAVVEGFLRFFDGISLADVTYSIAREAARVRATTNLTMPDAIVIATAIERGAAVVATNDGRWSAGLGVNANLRILQLGAFVRVAQPPA